MESVIEGVVLRDLLPDRREREYQVVKLYQVYP